METIHRDLSQELAYAIVEAGSTGSMKLSPYLMLESEVHGTGRLERMTMRRPEACEVGLMPTSILLSFDPCEEGGLTETEALCHGPKHIHLAQESEKLKGT